MKKLVSAVVAIAMIFSCFASITIVGYANVQDNASEYVFTIANDATNYPFRFKFVLLDTDSESTSSRFFVIASANYGAGPIHNAGDNSFSWDPTDANTLSGYLNSTWFNAGGPTTDEKPRGTTSTVALYTLIPQVKDYIDTNHEWAMPGYDGLTALEKTTITCGVTALSRDEHEAHKEKIGYVGDTATNHSNQDWWLRSPQDATQEKGLYIVKSSGNRGAELPTKTKRFRPCFWLGVDFFKNVKLDLDNTGSAVIAALKENYTRADLVSAGYTDDELNSLFLTVDETLTTTATVSGTSKPGYTLTASHDALDDGVAANYQWQQADTENGEFTDISGATATTYTLKNAQGEKYVRVKVALSKNNGEIVGAATYSNVAKVAAPLTPGAADNTNGGQSAINLTYRLTIPESVEGMSGMNETSRTYYLLDDTGSDDSKYLLIEGSAVARLATDATQGVQYTDASTNNRFDPDVEGSIAYWLKNTYAAGNATVSAPVTSILYENKLAPAFIPYLDTDHEWLTEGGCTQGPCTDDYVVKAPAAILSVTELKQYRDRFGWAEGTTWQSGVADFNMLRTPRETVVNVRLLWRTNDNNGSVVGGGIIANNTSSNTGAMLRPVFWLSKDVFKNVKLDLEKTGSGVINILKENYTREELALLGYTNEELNNIFITVDDSLTVDTTLSGTAKPGYTLTASHAALTDGVTASYQWQQADTENGEFTDISDATETSYTLKNAQGEKYVRLKVKLTKNGGEIAGPETFSNVAAVAAVLTPGAADNTNGGQEAINLRYRLTIPESVEGMSGMNESSRTYFLLDDTGSDDAKFLLIESVAVARLATDATQGVQYTDNTTNNKFDPDVESGIAYWLKNTYAAGEATASAPVASILNENKLAPALIPYLDTDHEWLTEGSCTQGPCVDDYVVKAPAAILSVTELKQYRNRFGWAEGTDWESGSADFNMLRTPRQNAVNVRLLWRTNDNNGSVVGGGIVANRTDANVGALLRPVFWLSKDVFKNVKLDVKKMGDGVKEMLINTYTREELSAIYSDAQLEEIGFEDVSVSNVLLSGIPTAGSQLTVNFDYSNSNSEAAENVKIQWMYSDSADTGYTEITGATERTYVIDSAYIGKYIKARVTPLDSANNEGTAVMSNHLGLIGAQKTISVINPVFAQDGANYKVSFSITNSGSTTPVHVIIAAYNKTDNAMIKANPQEVQVAGGTDTYSAVLENFTPDANTIVRAFVWNNLNDIIPLY